MRVLLCLAVALLCCAQDLTETGPTSLVIFYKCIPEKRIAFRNYMHTAGLDGFRRGKESGSLTDFRVLFSRYVDTNNWDMMTILWFRDYNTVQRWKHLERTAPAGIGDTAMANLASVSTYPVDMVRHGETSENPPEPVYLVIPYSGSSLEEFDSQQKPLLDGEVELGGLTRYALFTHRYPSGRPWDSLLMLGYRSDTDFGDRDKVAANVRLKLNLTTTGLNVSNAKEPVIADELTPGR